MAWEIRSNIQRIATIEALLLATGAAIPTDRKSNVPLWQAQRGFKSLEFHRNYKVTTDRRIKYLCNWIDITFRYETNRNMGHIIFNHDGIAALKKLVGEGFNLTEQSQPDEAARIKELKPFEILEVPNGAVPTE